MKGFRTIIAAAVGSVVTPLAVKYLGVPLSAEEQAQLVAAIMGALAIVMRFLTTGPVGQADGKPKPTVLTDANYLDHIDLPALLKRQNLRIKPKESRS